MTVISLERVRELVSYNRDTGEFQWKVDRENTVKAGDKAGYSRKDGYLILILDKKAYLGHRIAWLYETGAWPVAMIDHINCTPADNRFENLREATCSQNMMNMSPSRANTSGFKGISYCKRSNRWEAYITLNQRRRKLGYHKEIASAVEARKAAEAVMFGQFARDEIERLGSRSGGMDLPRNGGRE